MTLLTYLRSALATPIFLLVTAILSLTALALNFIFHSRKLDNAMVYIWASTTCWLFGVRIHVTGLENFPSDRQGALIVFNHSSFFDIFALTKVFPQLRFGAKSELFNIPIFGFAMRRIGILSIARQNREEVFKIYEEAKIRFQKGEKFALAPEGGRFHADNLAPFKSGPFLFSMSAQAPLVPIVIHGAHECLPKKDFIANKDRWCRDIFLTVLPMVSTENFAKENRSQLQEIVYQKMNAVWIQGQQKLLQNL